MKTVGERSVASFIRFVLDAAWWVGVADMALLFVLLVFSLWVKDLEGENLTMDLPIAVELTATVHGSSSSGQIETTVEKLRGNLRFPIQRDTFFFANVLLGMLLLGSLLWALTQLRYIFRSLSRGLLFIPENGRRSRWLGSAVIVGELARAALVYFWSYYTSLHFTANGLRFVPWTDLNRRQEGVECLPRYRTPQRGGAAFLLSYGSPA